MTPVRVGPFDDADHSAALAAAGLKVSQGGLKELLNWGGGHPPLCLEIINQLATVGSQEADNNAVTAAAQQAIVVIDDLLSKLWDDCDASSKDVYCMLTERNELASDGIGKDEVNCLLARGFAIRAGNKLKPSCRILQTHVRQAMPDTGSVKRLFGTWDNYRTEIRNILELRLNQIRPIVSTRLHNLVRSSIQQIPAEPDLALSALSHIEDQALDIIWTNEFGTSMKIPQDTISYWTKLARDNDRLIKGMMAQDNWIVPSSRSDQVGLLQYLTGSRNGFDSKSNAVSKDTYVLINAIHSFRNRNQHADGEQMHVGVAVAAIMTCLELLGCLARELAGDPNAC